MTDTPISDSQALDGGAIVETPESHRLAKLAGENARLRSEIRQALSRAQRAEADAKRVRASTKFAVGDLLVKSARNPRRLIVLPRDLLRLYRLRRHRRREPEPVETTVSSLRARRSDLTDEIAARLLLPRLGERPHAPLSIAGALDPLTAAVWSSFAAVTPVLPHEAPTLIAEADPDIAVIDTAAALPLGPWSHLGNPAAADRAIAAHELITAAQGLGRPVMLLRGPGDNPGFDALAARCDLVVDVPGRPRGRPAHLAWNPGVDLGLVQRSRPHLLTGESGSPSMPPESGIGVHVGTLSGRLDPAIASAWGEVMHESSVRMVELSPTASPVVALEQMLRDAHVVALHADTGHDIPGATLTAVATLLTGHRLVAADTPDLRHALSLGPDADPTPLGWFAYPAGDCAAARSALESALHAPSTDPRRLWQVWRSLFERASTVASWVIAVEHLGLGCRPQLMRQSALMVISTDEPTLDDRVTLRRILEEQTHRPREIVCNRAHLDAWRDTVAGLADPVISVHAIVTDDDVRTTRARAAQAIDSSVLIELQTRTLSTLPAEGVSDAIVALELADRHPVSLRLPDASAPVTVMRRTDALHPCGQYPIVIHHPGWVT